MQFFSSTVVLLQSVAPGLFCVIEGTQIDLYIFKEHQSELITKSILFESLSFSRLPAEAAPGQFKIHPSLFITCIFFTLFQASRMNYTVTPL